MFDVANLLLNKNRDLKDMELAIMKLREQEIKFFHINHEGLF
jgi:hypothetical protein